MTHKPQNLCAAFDCQRPASPETCDGLGRKYCSQACLDEYVERQRMAQELRQMAQGPRLGECI